MVKFSTSCTWQKVPSEMLYSSHETKVVSHIREKGAGRGGGGREGEQKTHICVICDIFNTKVNS